MKKLFGLILLILSQSCYQQPAELLSTQTFLDWYWSRPLSAQGKPPSPFSSVEIALNPNTCGQCHPNQWKDWQHSIHRRAMGAGVLGQLINLPIEAHKEQQACLHCHAPLNEQAQSLITLLSHTPFPSTESRLHEQGVMCAVCHLREFQWYGPPQQAQTPSKHDPRQTHTWQSHPAFSDAQFCAACHQFQSDEYALNGKLLENTYQEWQQSRYGKAGITCQNCHLPQRRHLWRGIHDPEMTKTGVHIDIQQFQVTMTEISAELHIQNSGTGHYFPTYLTPKITVQGYQEDQQGQPLSHTIQEYVIQRQVTIDLSEEIADTRLAPDEQHTFYYEATKDTKATTFVFHIRVEPDAFYTEFYRALLKQNLAGTGEPLIKQAFEDSKNSAFTLYLKKLPLNHDH